MRKKTRKISTPLLEAVAYDYLKRMGTYVCREVSMPTERRLQKVIERVDMCSLDTKSIWRFYELKITTSDFRSHNHNTFYGNFNYYILAPGIYEKVQDEIPSHIGVYTLHEDSLCMYCAKPAHFQDLGVDFNKLQFNFLQALSREYDKEQMKRGQSLMRAYNERV